MHVHVFDRIMGFPFKGTNGLHELEQLQDTADFYILRIILDYYGFIDFLLIGNGDFYGFLGTHGLNKIPQKSAIMCKNQ